MSGFIGVHIGAGQHSEKLQAEYEQICKVACRKGIEALKSKKSALDAVTIATAALEDSPLTNAGLGSNLTWDGQVECDASIMDGCRLGFGAVGAVSRLKNPIVGAKSLCLAQYEQLSLNRVPPCLLVSAGAEKWAAEREIELVEPQSLVTSRALNMFKKYKRRIELMPNCADKAICNNSSEGVTSQLLDTVGAIAVDSEGRLAASCSSGGIALKHPGRLGQNRAIHTYVGFAEGKRIFQLDSFRLLGGCYLWLWLLGTEFLHWARNRSLSDRVWRGLDEDLLSEGDCQFYLFISKCYSCYRQISQEFS